MTDDDGRLDELLERAKPHLIVQVTAAILAINGLFLSVAGLQTLMFLNIEGLWMAVPILQLGCGLGSVVAAAGMSKQWGPAGVLALVVSALAALVAGIWMVGSTMLGILSPLVHANAALSAVSFLLVGVSIVPFFRCVSARKELTRELDGSPGGGSLAPLAGILGVGLLAAGAWFVLQGVNPGRPIAIVVQVRGGVEEETDARLAKQFAAELADIGLDAVHNAQTLPADAPIDAVRKAASDADAAHAVVLDLTTIEERDGMIGGTKLYAVTCTAHYLSSDTDEVKVSEPMEFAYEGISGRDIVRKVDHAWVEGLAPWVIEQVYTSGAFAPVLEGDVDFDDMQVALEMAGWEEAVWQRRDRAQGFTDYCDLESERLAALQSGEVTPISCLGNPCGQSTLLGVDASGRAIVQESTRKPFFPVPLAATNSWSEPPERIFAVGAAGEETNLFRSGNFYDFGKVSRNGKYVAMETFGSDHTEAIVTLATADGSQADLVLLEPRERTRYMLPSPDGSRLLAWLDGGDVVLLSAGERVAMPPMRQARWVELPDGPAIAGQLDDDSLVLFDRDGQQLPGKYRLGGRLVDLYDAGNELAALVQDDHDCRLDRMVETTLARTSRKELPSCLNTPRMLPDGRLVGTAKVTMAGDIPGDREVVVWTPGDDKFTQLTSGSFREETVYATADGSRVFFNRRLESWPNEYDVNLYRRVVCWADVPVM